MKRNRGQRQSPGARSTEMRVLPLILTGVNSQLEEVA